MTLFDDREIVGTFYGFKGGGLTPAAELLFKHDPEYPTSPIIGMPVLVRLDRDDEALLVRIAEVAPGGSLATDTGTDYVMRNIRTGDFSIPENIRETKLTYNVRGRPLGVLTEDGDGRVQFMPTHRRIPPLGSPVTFARNNIFQAVMNASDDSAGVAIGHAALGEFVWGDVDSGAAHVGHGWIRPQQPVTKPRFDINQLVARRSFVLAKAGYGKSNLVKLLFSELYANGTPKATRRDKTELPVGCLIGDLDGEYFWGSADNPGFSDIDHLRDHLVVFTDRTPPSDAHGSFVAGGLKLDIREVLPGRILPLILPRERLTMTNVTTVMELDLDRWRQLVDLVATTEMDQADGQMTQLLRGSSEMIRQGAYRNVRQAINAIHDENSALLDDVATALRDGKLVVLDLSLVRSRAQSLLGIVLSRVFEHNMLAATDLDGGTIPVIAVIEEAQNVLDGSETEVTRPFIEFTKEGRKFYCGIMGITQQPGSIDNEIISQSDNFFAFHLLSEGDLTTLRRANPHFSDDILSSLLNEPLVGSGYFVSLHSEKQYPIPFRPFDFAKRYPGRLASGAALDVYASQLRKNSVERRRQAEPEKEEAIAKAADVLRTDRSFQQACSNGTAKPARVQFAIRDFAPQHMLERDNAQAQGNEVFKQPSMKWADSLVDRTLDAVFGSGNWEYVGGNQFRGKNKIKANPPSVQDPSAPSDGEPPDDEPDDEPPF